MQTDKGRRQNHWQYIGKARTGGRHTHHTGKSMKLCICGGERQNEGDAHRDETMKVMHI